jgi:thiol:disulfide interchange protein DsbC
MKTRYLLLCAALLPLMACGDSVGAPSAAAAQAGAEKAGADPRIALAAKIPGVRVEDLRKAPMPGIYELVHDNDVSYITADGKYVFSGDLYKVADNGEFPNLSEARRRELEASQWGVRLKRVGSIPESQMLVFGPADAKHTITVFTDIDCPWCRKLHAQVADYNKLGIRVRYLFYPRTGPDTDSWYKAEAVWCAKDRNQAMTQAKLDQPFDVKRCADTPVGRDYALGREFGLKGTPGIILETGELVPGYLGPRDLLARIDSSVALAAAAK